MSHEGPLGRDGVRDRWFEMAQDLLCETSLDGYFTRLSPSWERCLGFTRAELMARPYIEFVHPDDRGATRARAADLADGPAGFGDFENRYATKDGGWRWLCWRQQSNDGDRVYLIASDVTQRKADEKERMRAVERLRRSESLQRTLTANLPDMAMFLLDQDLRVVVGEGSGLRGLGWIDESMFRGRRVEDLFEVPADVRERSIASYRAAFAGERAGFTVDSEGRTLAVQVVPITGDDGGVESVLIVVRDTTRETLAERQLAERAAEQETLARQQAAVARLGQLALGDRDLLELMDEVVATVAATLGIEYCAVVEIRDSGDLMDTVAVVGGPEGIELSGLPVTPGSQVHYLLETHEPLVVEDYATETRFQRSELLAATGVTGNMGVIIEGRDRPFGAIVAHTTQRRSFGAGDVNFLTAVANLLSAAVERHRDEESSRHAALHDPLTGLPNRTLALDRLAVSLARRRREGTNVAALMLDLDRFKVINDSLGHAAGDELLLALASRLRATVRPQDTVARLSGDEFVVVCESPASVREVIALAERIATAVRQALTLSSGEHFVSASIGIAIADSAQDTSASLLRDADAAMYRAKSRGPGRYELFDDAMRRTVMARLRIETELRSALERGELRVHYQPIVAIADGRTLGCEALVRWQHPERGLIAPLDFIPVAEETGLIIDIGRWVLEQACRQGAEWQRRGRLALQMSVNVSARQLANPQFPAQAAEIARRSGLLPGTLRLEVTESVLMEEADSPVAVLNKLREHGLRLILDDFGTGYSSLSYLKHFPLDGVKIDRLFTAGLDGNPMDVAIVRAIIDMSRAGGMTVVAEGVETEDQLAQLRALGCERVQGYLFSPPLPAEAIGELLAGPLPAAEPVVSR